MRLQLRVPLPEHWSLIVGDCLQDLRSALRHIALELALDHSPQHNPRRVALPIADTEDAWLGLNGNSEQRRYVSMMSSAAQAAVEQLQPFVTSPQRPDLNVVWKLLELARDDRHQTVHLFVQLTYGDFTQLEEAGRRGNLAHPNPLGARFITRPISSAHALTSTSNDGRRASLPAQQKPPGSPCFVSRTVSRDRSSNAHALTPAAGNEVVDALPPAPRRWSPSWYDVLMFEGRSGSFDGPS